MNPSFDAEPPLKSLHLVCAWCGLQMTDHPPESPERVSHGICPPCFHAVIVTLETSPEARACSPLPSTPTK